MKIPGGLDIETADPKPKRPVWPTIGRIVHFVDENVVTGDLKCRAAILSHVWEQDDPELYWSQNVGPDDVRELEPVFMTPGSEWVALHVLTIRGTMALPFVCHDELTKAAKTWHWPERLHPA